MIAICIVGAALFLLGGLCGLACAILSSRVDRAAENDTRGEVR